MHDMIHSHLCDMTHSCLRDMTQNCTFLSLEVRNSYTLKCTHMNESEHLCEGVMSRVWMSQVTCMNESGHYMNESCHYMNESCHTYDWVTQDSALLGLVKPSPVWLIHICDMTHSCMWHDSFWVTKDYAWSVVLCDSLLGLEVRRSYTLKGGLRQIYKWVMSRKYKSVTSHVWVPQDYALLSLEVRNAYTLKGGLRHIGGQLHKALTSDFAPSAVCIFLLYLLFPFCLFTLCTFFVFKIYPHGGGLYIYIYIYMCVYIYLYVYIYIYMYVCMYYAIELGMRKVHVKRKEKSHGGITGSDSFVCVWLDSFGGATHPCMTFSCVCVWHDS